MIILNTTNKSLEIVLDGAVATNQPVFFVSYTDVNQTTFAAAGDDSSDGATNSDTPVELLAAPGADTSRQVNYISVYNADTEAVEVEVRLNNNTTIRSLIKITLPVNKTLQYTIDGGWEVVDKAVNLTVANGIRQGDPYEWETGDYSAGEVTTHNSRLWVANTDTSQEPSDAATDWDLFLERLTTIADADDTAITDPQENDILVRRGAEFVNEDPIISLWKSQYGDRLIMYDSFNRSDGAVGDSDSGHTPVVSGSYEILSKELKPTANTNGHPYNMIVWGVEQVEKSILIDLPTRQSFGRIRGVVLSYTDSDNYWIAGIDSLNTLEIRKVVGGSPSTPDSTAILVNSRISRLATLPDIKFDFAENILSMTIPGIPCRSYTLDSGEETHFNDGAENVGIIMERVNDRAKNFRVLKLGVL